MRRFNVGGLGYGGGSVVVDSLLIVAHIVGFCNCSVLLCVTLCPF